jgi:hypothetical protein
MKDLKNLSNYEILFSIRVLYNYHSDIARKYGEDIIAFLKEKHVEEGSIDFHVPLILKTIKYCSKHRLGCNDLVEFVINNMDKFKVIFERKNISKGLLFSLIFEKINTRTSS